MTTREIIVIAALGETNQVIGNQGQVPWYIPEDSQRFGQLTWGHTVVMGRRTWLGDLGGQPLPGRRNIVISSTHPGQGAALFVTSLEAALDAAKGERVFIAGGARVYAEALPLADTLELTLVKGNYPGDTFFPPYRHLIGRQFTLIAEESHPGFRYVTYGRLASGRA